MRWKPSVESGLLLPEMDKKRRGGVPDNASDPAEWDKMPDDHGPIYKVLCSAISCKSPKSGRPDPNDTPRYGWFLHGKDLGPGAEIQRLLDLKMIREADPGEIRRMTEEKRDTVFDDDGARPLKSRDKAPPHKVVNSPIARA